MVVFSMCMLFNPYVFYSTGTGTGVVENGCNGNGAGTHHTRADHFKDLRLLGDVGDLAGVKFYTAVAHDEGGVVLSFVKGGYVPCTERTDPSVPAKHMSSWASDG